MSKRAVQPNLPGMPTLSAWMAEWLDENHPDSEFPWEETRDRMKDELPWRFIPKLDALTDKWWVSAYNLTMKRLDRRKFERTLQDGETVVAVGALDEQLSLLDLLDSLTGSLVLGRQDIDAVRRRLDRWNAANPGQIENVPYLFSEMLESVGLAMAANDG